MPDKQNTASIKRGRPFKQPVPPEPKKKYHFDDFYQTLLMADDMLGRAHMVYVLIGNTARVVMGIEQEFKPPITLGALSTALTNYALNTLYLNLPPTIEVDSNNRRSLILPTGEIKTKLVLFDNSPRPIENFDLRFFNYDIWRVPNPLHELQNIMNQAGILL